eukprot:6183802-Pleurochrysis_carterae.AAC.1
MKSPAVPCMRWSRRLNATCLEWVPSYHNMEFRWRWPEHRPNAASLDIERLSPVITMTKAEAVLLQVNLINFKNTVLCYNPFVMDNASNVLYNMKHGGAANISDFPGIAHNKVVWVDRSAAGAPNLRYTLLNAEDARGVVWRGERLAFFTRYSGYSRKDPWLIHLKPPFKQVKLLYPNRTASEGNWLPFVHKRRLYVSYSLCPHRVLLVNPHNGHCKLVFETVPARCSRWDRGSASGFVDEHGAAVGLGHQKGVGLYYHHFFYRRSSIPPFPIISRSADFKFPKYFNVRNIWDRVQFCLSVRQDGSGLTMDFSTMDAVPLSIHMPRRQYCNFTAWC